MLSKTAIEGFISDGSIVCMPFRPQNLNPASLDVTLGNYIIWVNDYDGQPQVGKNDDSDIFIERLSLTVAFAPTGMMVRIPPKSRIIAHTDEFIGTRNTLNAKMHAKSTVGRYGIEVCSCAGLGDPGFYSRWAMEIYNKNDSFVQIRVGCRIAQLSFYGLNPPVKESDMYYNSGSYQKLKDPIDIVSKWNWRQLVPQRMIEDAHVSLHDSLFENITDDTRMRILNG